MSEESKKSIPILRYKTDGSESFDRDQPGATPKAVDRVLNVLQDCGVTARIPFDLLAERIVAAVHDGD